MFSIVIASYNNGQYLSEAIQSAQNQTFTDIEIVIIDDSSSDNSWEIIAGFQNNDSRIKACRLSKNRGVGYTKREGIILSTREVIGFLDADDVLLPNAVEEMIRLHYSFPKCSLIYSDLINCDSKLIKMADESPNGAIEEGESYLTHPEGAKHISHFATFKRSSYLMTEGLNPKFKKAIDKDLYYKLEEVGDIFFYDKPLYLYRHHSNSISLFNNTLKARLWGIKAMSAAQKRRKHLSIRNLTAKDIKREYVGTYKMLVKESLDRKKHLHFLYYSAVLLFYTKSVLAVLKYGYYCLLLKHKPELF